MQGSPITISRQWHMSIQGGNSGRPYVMAPSYLCSKYQYTLKFRNEKGTNIVFMYLNLKNSSPTVTFIKCNV